MSDTKQYTDSQRRAFDEGKEARKEGRDLTEANPYPQSGNDEHASFNAGFGTEKPNKKPTKAEIEAERKQTLKIEGAKTSLPNAEKDHQEKDAPSNKASEAKKDDSK